MTSDSEQRDEKLYSTLVNTIRGIIWEADPLTFRFFFVSPHAERILGYPVQQWINEPDFWLIHTHPDDVARCSDLCRDASLKEEDPEFEYRMIAADGRIVWLHDIVTVVRTDNGELRLRGIMFDITNSKAQQLALLAETTRWQLMMERSRDGIIIMDAASRTVHDVNPAFAEMLGYSSHEMIGMHPWNWDLSFSREQIEAMRCEQREEEIFFETRMRRKDKKVLDVEVRSTSTELGGERQLFCICRDITERKRAEDEIRRDKALLRCLIDSVGDLIFIKDVNGVYQACNKAAEEFIGLPESEQIGKTDFDFFDRDVAEHIRENDLQILDSGKEGRSEEWVTYRDGSSGLLDTVKAPFYGPDGKQLGLVGIARDITERKQMEELLRQERELCLDMVNNQPAGIYRIRVTPKYLRRKDAWNIPEYSPYSVELVNDRLCEILGITRQDIETNPGIVIDLVHAEDRAEFARKNKDASDRLIPFQWEGRLKIEGEIIWVHFESLPRPLADGDVLWTGILYDITGQKQVEAEKEKLEAQNRQLQKSESLGRMAGAIAHYFNNQLGAVIGNLEMATYELPKGSGPVSWLAEAMQAAEKAAEMSGLMLTYLGQTFGKREPLDLSEVCRQTLANLQIIMPGNVVLETDLSSPGPVISTNANRIQQVLINLATNAWEAFGEGRGTIQINLKTVSSSEIPVSHRFPIDWQPQDHAYACLEVMDGGCGIASKDIEKLFDPFFSSKFTGRGLGLPVVLGIVKAHDGAVTVESELGRGSRFRVFLPESAEEVQRKPDEALQPLATEGGGTVLVVEDDPMVRNIAAAMITHLGFSVIVARDGVDAVEVFGQHRDEIRCVLCDLTMPRMNGWETLTALRELVPGIPVILASGYDEAQVMEGDHPELPQAFLGKPYKHKELSDAINHALTSKGISNLAPKNYAK